MTNILVPIDFSEQSKHAAEFACKLSDKDDVNITFLHVVEYPTGATVDPVGASVPAPYDRDFLDLLMDNGREKLGDFSEEFESYGVDNAIIMGNPYIVITDQITEKEADLIVMGTKGASGFKEFFIGSNAEKVVRMAKCPVITVSEKTDASQIKNIVYATELLDVSKSIVQKLKELQNLFQAVIHIVRVNTPNSFERDDVALKVLKESTEKFMLKDFTINVYNDIHEDQGIISFARSIDADMIALGTHGRRGLSHLLAGSLAEDVVNHAKLPVWTFHINDN